jgi:anti-anti-sigma factor
MLAPAVHVYRKGSTVVVELEGEFDAWSSRPVELLLVDLIDNQGNLRIEIELSRTLFIDSAALAVLYRASSRSRSHGGKLVLSRPSEPVDKFLLLSGFGRAFTILR